MLGFHGGYTLLYIYIYLFAYIYTIRVHHRGRSIYPRQAELSKLTASAGELRRSRGGAGMEGPLKKRKPR